MKIKLFTFCLVSICLLKADIFSQEINALDILKKTSEACKAIDYIEYDVLYEAGAQTVSARVIQKKADVKDVGLGKAKMIVNGVSKTPGNEQPFQFSYDGNGFKFYEVGKGELKKVENPTARIVGGMLGLNYYMLVLSQFGNDDGMDGLISRLANAKYVDKVEINGKLTYHLVLTQSFTHPVTKEANESSSDWYFDIESYLPIRNVSKSISRTIRLISREESAPPVEFDINAVSKFNELTVTGKEAKTDGLPEVGDILPPFMLENFMGEEVSLSDLPGEIFIIDFWGTWCGPCLLAMPDLQELHKEYNKKGLTIVGISVSDKEGKPEKYVKSKGYSYTFLLNGDTYARGMMLDTFPTLFIVDKKGNILHAEKGRREEAKKEFTRIIKTQLGIE